jgi:hypothetical protein
MLRFVGKHHNFSAGLLIGGRKDVDTEKGLNREKKKRYEGMCFSLWVRGVELMCFVGCIAQTGVLCAFCCVCKPICWITDIGCWFLVVVEDAEGTKKPKKKKMRMIYITCMSFWALISC